MKIKYNGKLNSYAASLRKDMTKEERKLWHCFLRQYPVKFYRQKIIGNYIVDFYCEKAGLVIELDGSQHFETECELKDRERDEFISSLGLKVVRIANNQINKNFRGVCEYLDNLINDLIN